MIFFQPQRTQRTQRENEFFQDLPFSVLSVSSVVNLCNVRFEIVEDKCSLKGDR